ncbi:hypothetical protein B0T14DRAFT_246061 [Immersiella caudata]|uniref:Uncharacterized protein n=1 Tax=Immersiella caudata TaxID=314043 RepID=A0AA39WJ99_9PEZI|nr:hypothetical protein B0T14DRAFT_246061 [Immersiella caudata]
MRLWLRGWTSRSLTPDQGVEGLQPRMDEAFDDDERSSSLSRAGDWCHIPASRTNNAVLPSSAIQTSFDLAPSSQHPSAPNHLNGTRCIDSQDGSPERTQSRNPSAIKPPHNPHYRPRNVSQSPTSQSLVHRALSVCQPRDELRISAKTVRRRVAKCALDTGGGDRGGCCALCDLDAAGLVSGVTSGHGHEFWGVAFVRRVAHAELFILGEEKELLHSAGPSPRCCGMRHVRFDVAGGAL